MNKDYSLEFVTTACIRPDIFRRTLTSFYENLQGVNWRSSILYLNIDPFPEMDKKKQANQISGMISIANEFFAKVDVNLPKQGNLTAALKWGVARVVNPLFFHLQDDFVLTSPIQIGKIAPLISKRWSDPKFNGNVLGPQVIQVCLRTYNVIKDQRLCLTPALCSSSFFKNICNLMDETVNPEVQLRSKTPRNKYGVLHHECKAVHYPDGKEVIKDIGRDWLKGQELERNAGRNGFVTWKRREDRKGFKNG